MPNYYVDPAMGSSGNAGTSPSKPWRTLAEVFASGKVFRPGDVIYLARGLHGAVQVRGVIVGGSVTIAALPNHSPVLSSLTFAKAVGWVVREVIVHNRIKDEGPLGLAVSTTREITAGGPPHEGTDSKVDGDDAVDKDDAVDVALADAPDDVAAAAAADAAADADAADAAADVVDAKDASAEDASAEVALAEDPSAEVALAEVALAEDALAEDASGAAVTRAAAAAPVPARGITISTQALEDCSDIVLDSVTQLCGQSSAGWSVAQWIRARSSGGIHIYGRNITVRNCHVYNAAGVYINFHSTGATIHKTIIENFCSDAMNIKASRARVEQCIIVGSLKVDGNHNDLCQAWDSSDVVFKGNRLVAYRGAPGPFTARDVQGLGAFDGWKRGWEVTNNLVATDHPIGIWIQGDDKCIVGNNTVIRCGPALWFARQPTSILLGPHKSGAVKGGSQVYNNLAEAYRLTGSGALARANQVLKPGAMATTFVAAPIDVHLRDTAAAARGTGSGAAIATAPPSVDADGVPRPTSGAVDAGCLQFSAAYTPPRPTPFFPTTSIVAVPGLGYDVAWAPLGPYRSIQICIAGGPAVALCRTGRTCFFVFDPSVTSSSRKPVLTVRGIPDL